MAINSVVLVGRLGKDPEVKKTGSDVSYCNFSLAVDRNYKNGDERLTDWIDCSVWRGTADFLGKYFRKGDMVGVTGSLERRSWETDAGEKRSVTYVNVDNVSFVGGKSNGQDDGQRASSAPTASGASAWSEEADAGDGELPF